MSSIKKHKTRFRNNLQQFIALKDAGKLNGAATQIKEKLKAAAGAVDLDFLKEYKTVYKNITRKNPKVKVESKEGTGTVYEPNRADSFWRGDSINVNFVVQPWHTDPKKAVEEFNLAGIEFGNWLSEKDRTEYLAKSMQGLHNLSKVLGIMPAQIGLNGKLGIAFGARGRGSALAHYEGNPKPVINLTKEKGQNSLAHEYGHSLDNALSSQSSQKWITGGRTTSRRIDDKRIKDDGLAGIAEKIFKKLYYTEKGKKSEFYNRLSEGTDYERRRIEVFARCVDMYVSIKCNAKKIPTNHLSHDFKGGGVTPTVDEMEAVLPLFDTFFKTLFAKIKVRKNPCGCQHRKNPETATVCLDEIDCNVTVQAKTNATKGGIEIRFSDDPGEGITDQLKDHDFWFYTPEGDAPFWAGEITTENKALAEKIAGKFDSAVLKGSVKNLKDNRKQKTYKNFEKDDLVKFVGLPKEVNGKKNPLIGKGGVVVNSQPLDVDVKIEGYGTVGFLPKNLVKTLQLKESQRFVDKNKLSPDQQPLGSTIDESLTGLKYELGAETTVDFKADGSIQKVGDYAIVEVRDLQASHNKDCSANSKHEISRSQPRDRSKKALCAQPSFIAKNLNPASITQGNLAFVGAPTVNAKAHTIQGNGRSIALKIAYDEIEESASRYRSYLLDNAAKFGLSKSQIKQFDQPVLVRMLSVDDETAIELGNVVDTSQAKMSKIDQAKAYIRNLSEFQLQVIGNLIQDSSGETIGAIIDDIGMDIIGQLKELDRTEIVEKGKLTGEGKDFLRSVLVGLVFDGQSHPNALHHYMNLPHTIKAGIERSFGYIIPLIGKGDVRDQLSRAVEIAAQTYRNDAIDSASEYAGSQDMFEAKDFSKDEVGLAQFFLDATTQKEIRDAFGYYVELLQGKENLFGKVPPKSKKEAFRMVFVDRARPNPGDFLDEIIHKTIVRAQRLENFNNDNSAELEKLDNLLGRDGWKWNDKQTQIIRLDNEESRRERLIILEHFRGDTFGSNDFDRFKDWIKKEYPNRSGDAETIWNTVKPGAWRKNPALTADVKRSVLDDFFAWMENNPLMDYTPGAVTFKTWIPYHYPGYENEWQDIWDTARPALRANPEARFISIGLCDKISIDQGNPEPVLLQGPLAMLTNKSMNKLFIVPLQMIENFNGEVEDLTADEIYNRWHHFAPDNNNYSFNWPDHETAHPVGTAVEIFYISDKVMRAHDSKGDMNIYHHTFDAGKRPCVKKRNILIVNDLKINENGILN